VKTIMLHKLSLVAVFLPALALAQTSGDESIPALIKALGNANNKVRDSAHESLNKRPEAAPALRDALKSPDAEVARRAADILDYFEQRPMRDLAAAAKDGRPNRMLQIIASFPDGKHEDATWEVFRNFGLTLLDRHKKQNGVELAKLRQILGSSPRVLSAKRITEATKGDLQCRYFLRTDEIDFDGRRWTVGEPRQNTFLNGATSVSCTGIFRASYPVDQCIIVAGGTVTIGPGDFNDLLIVCCSDVVLECGFGNALVIARGSVKCTGFMDGCCIISGKSAKVERRGNLTRHNIIIENESNPLGYIHWSDVPKEKEKAAPKSK
jgi:hypothetical protein